MAKQKDEKSLRYYSHMLISKGKRMVLFVTCTLMFLAFLGLTFEGLSREYTWQTLAGYFAFIGLAALLVPDSERWVYRPWQAKPQKYEHHGKY